MKKFLAIIVVVAALGALYMWKVNSPAFNTNTQPTGEGFKPDPSNATFVIDDQEVTLSNGAISAENYGGETRLLPERAYGDLNNDGKDDAILLLANSSMGSGVFIYAAAYISGPVGYKGTNTIFIGDRIAPESISVTNGVATVHYLDRASDEPFATEPSISTAKVFVYKNGELQER